MSFVVAIVWFFLGALFTSLFDGEFKFRYRQMAQLMVHAAVRQMPLDCRERMHAEWLAELETLENEGRDGAQIGYALGVLHSVSTTKLELLSEEEAQRKADVLSRRSARLFAVLINLAGPFMLLSGVEALTNLSQMTAFYSRWFSFGLGLAGLVLANVAFLSINFSRRAEKLHKIAKGPHQGV